MVCWHFDDLALAARALKRPSRPQDSNFTQTPVIVVVILLAHLILRPLLLSHF